ncbi:ATP-NAD kinase family protein [Streptomyces sp. NPDC056638]|uniref:ATP-NAD kinase family protein n=1 Tax=Streptomyces sp. NPDC056638 TaxID=3345887 RepID=UPI00367BADE5
MTAAGPLGADSVAAAGLAGRVVYAAGAGRDTSAEDTAAAVRAVVAEGVDLLLFAGGDGTARDVLGALRDVPCPVLGIPTGVKMHSAVFAISPRAAGEVAAAWLARSSTVRLRDAEVMDRDEDALSRGRVASQLFGWLRVPDVPARVQQRKTGSTATTPEAVGGIATDVAERVGDGLLVLGPGSTTRAVAAGLGADVSLTGVDVLRLRPGHRPRIVARDAGEDTLLSVGPAWIALSPIGGQGFLLGRGNQQISPRVLRAAGGRERLLVLCTEQKLATLGGRPLLLDTGDDALNAELSGHLPVITGRRRTSLYRLVG